MVGTSSEDNFVAHGDAYEQLLRQATKKDSSEFQKFTALGTMQQILMKYADKKQSAE